MVVATAIAAGRLTGEMVADIAAGLGDGAGPDWHWLDRGDAARVLLPPGTRLAGARDTAAGLAADLGCDVVVTANPVAVPRVLLADMDSTMITVECIDELADRAGLKDRVAAVTERAMRGEMDFADALRERVALLAGLPTSVIADVLRDQVRPTPGGATLIATLKALGARTVLVSGGFEPFAHPVGRALGFDRVVANRLAVGSDGRLSGALDGPIVDAAVKAAVLEDARGSFGPEDADRIIAIGDGANDLPMLAAAGLGVAYRAKPRVAAAADARLDRHGLDALLWVLGLPRARWTVVDDPADFSRFSV